MHSYLHTYVYSTTIVCANNIRIFVTKLYCYDFFTVTIPPLPPTNVDVCVSFDTSGNPTLRIQWQVSTNVIPTGNSMLMYVHICRGTEMMNRIA